MTWLLAAALAAPVAAAAPLRVGSKAFNESVVLGEIARRSAEGAGGEAVHTQGLGGTQFVWKALLRGDIDVYPEYTGTLLQEVFHGKGYTEADLPAALDALGLGMTRPLGFNNTYALGLSEERAQALRIETLSDLARHPELRLGLSEEFLDRADGWPAVKKAYGLPQTAVKAVQHDLGYRGLAAGSIDVKDLYSTDAEIRYFDLRALVDDKGFFPAYKAVFVYRKDAAVEHPEALRALRRLAGRIPESKMIAMNAAVKIEKRPAAKVAADFIAEEFGIRAAVQVLTPGRRLVLRGVEHLRLVVVSLLAAILLGLPLGVVAARHPRLAQPVLAVTGIIQTIPSLALLVFMIPLAGIGEAPAMIALFLYSLLPIVRNTYAGLDGIQPALRESAEALGLREYARYRWVYLPMALPTILAGIKTSAVINVGTATLGALIGAGGYGQPILTGIRLDDTGLILQGAVPAAALALLVQGAFDLAERWMVSPGLRGEAG